MTFFSLQDLNLLKNVKRVSPRVSIGRLFKENQKLGIKDNTHTLWPIAFETSAENLNPGDIIQFYGEFKNGILHIKKILQIVKQTKNNHKSLNLNYATLQQRNDALERTKKFFLNRDFFYAETPLLVQSGGMETYLHSFQTTYRDYHGREWVYELPTSPEFALKKLIAEGIPKIFQISRAFRNNGESSPWHEPEFMMLEWYRVGATLEDIMKDTQQLVLTLAKFLKSKTHLPKTWKTFHVKDLFLDLLHVNLGDVQETQVFYEKTKHICLSLRTSDTWNDIFCKLFMEKIEPFLKQQVACFVTGYPAQMSALAQNKTYEPLFVERTEAYLFGIEICNAYQELVDAAEFEKRFELVLQERKQEIKRDAHFENVMKFGLPYCAGNAVGIDRVIALLLDLPSIQALFPIPFN